MDMVGCLLRITVFIVILCKRRNYLNKELKNAVEAADAKAQYDECAKRLLGLKSILSYIFAHTIEAFQGMKPKEIIPYIEGEPYIGDVPVEPGLTNAAREQNGQRVTGLNTENREIHEGVVQNPEPGSFLCGETAFIRKGTGFYRFRLRCNQKCVFHLDMYE